MKISINKLVEHFQSVEIRVASDTLYFILCKDFDNYGYIAIFTKYDFTLFSCDTTSYFDRYTINDFIQ